jgi:hypothetical protein
LNKAQKSMIAKKPRGNLKTRLAMSGFFSALILAPLARGLPPIDRHWPSFAEAGLGQPGQQPRGPSKSLGWEKRKKRGNEAAWPEKKARG